MDMILNAACKELKNMEHSGNVDLKSSADRKAVKELLDIKKAVLEIEAMEHELGLEPDGDLDNYSGSRHYVRAHYSRAGGADNSSMARRNGMGRRSSQGGYSGAGDEMMGMLDDMLDAEPDDRRRDIIMRFRDELRRMA